MSDEQIRIFPLGDSGLTVEFGQEISIALNDKAIALSRHLDKFPFHGHLESVPAFASTSVYFDPLRVRRAYPEQHTAFAAAKSLVGLALAEMEITSTMQANMIEIPVRFGGEAGPDLIAVANHNGLDPDHVVSIFTGSTYRVFMLGFLPGFAYLGELDERIVMRRRETPRMSVPSGSVGIAGRQTGIYALDSPGGWQIIGRTNVEMFTPHDESPCRVKPGDQVRLVAVR